MQPRSLDRVEQFLPVNPFTEFDGQFAAAPGQEHVHFFGLFQRRQGTFGARLVFILGLTKAVDRVYDAIRRQAGGGPNPSAGEGLRETRSTLVWRGSEETH